MPSLSKPVTAQERANHIMNKLLQQDYVTVTQFAEELDVSAATIRKDLTALEAQGLLRRTHGGATHVRELTYEIRLFYQNRAITHLIEKRRIGQYAAQRVQPNEIVAFSGGSTTSQIAHHLVGGVAFTAISNDLKIVQTLAQNEAIDIFVPGGYLRLGRENLVGQTAINALKDFQIDRVFLSVTGLDVSLGATAGHISHVVYLRALLARAQERIVVADASKLDNPPQIVICGWDQVDILITDNRIPTEKRSAIEAHDVHVIAV